MSSAKVTTRASSILALSLWLAGDTWLVFAQSRLEFVRKEFGSALRLQMHSVGRGVFPDHSIEASDDLSTWRTVHFVRGGIDVWPVEREFGWATGERRQFFRVRERLDVTGANLAGANLSGQNHSGANLPWADLMSAQLADADFSGANLIHARLRGAVLRGANLRNANLCHADLTGAIAGAEDLVGAALLNTRLPDGTFATDDSLAEALALDVSSELTAPTALYMRFRRDLAAIRAVIPGAIPEQALFEWGVPNGLHVSVNEQQFAALNASELGPVFWRENHPSYIQFARRYHPRALSLVLRSQFAITQIEPFRFAGSGSYVRFDEADSKYTFDLGFGDCPSGCLQRFTWVVTVDDNGEVTVLQEPGQISIPELEIP